MSISSVAVLGGAHGNEWSGVRVVEDFLPVLLASTQYPFQVTPSLVNIKAIEVARRFIDFDMNRISAHLEDKSFSHHYEWQRATQIKNTFNEKKIDFIIDMHTTTSNMGVTLILTELTPFLASLCSYVQIKMSDVRVLIAPDPSKKYLVSQAHAGIMIEVGPCTQAVNDAKIIQQTSRALELLLEAIKIDFQPQIKNLEYFEEKADFYYPDKFMIHPKFQNSDYQQLNPATPIFIDINGKEIFSTKEHVGHAIFINICISSIRQ